MFKTIQEACFYLEQRKNKRTIDQFKCLLDQLSLPYHRLKMIHVAGTNGKGSTVSNIRCLLTAMGYKTGSFTSPYMISHNDRICIDGFPISDASLLALVNKWYEVIEKYELSMFECDTLLMFDYFLKEKVDFAVIETGIGGLNDKTNVIMPIASVITNIGHDHLTVLGPTLKDVAIQKGGIIKENIPVFCGVMEADLKHVLEDISREKKAPIYFSKPPLIDQYPLEFTYKGYSIKLGNKALYQVNNACLAIDVIHNLFKNQLNQEIINNAFQNSVMPCRFECFELGKGTLYLDGAHNLEAMQSLIQTVKVKSERKIYVIYAALADKEYEHMAQLLQEAGFIFSVCQFDDERALSYEQALKLKVPYHDSFESALKAWNSNCDCLVTGSLHFVSAFRKYLLEKY